jgi:hypothetical protein
MRYCRPFWIGHFEVSYERDENMENRHLTFNPLPVRGGEETRHPSGFALLPSSLHYDAASRRGRRPRLHPPLPGFGATRRRIVMNPLHCKAWLLLIGGCLLLSGCVAPHYTNHQLVLFGKAAPSILAADDPGIQANLGGKPAPKVSLLAAVTGFATTPFKCLGIQGWKDYHLQAEARGTMVQHRVSSDRFLTVDLRLDSLFIDGVPILLSDAKFIRLEIFLGKVSVEKSIFAEEAVIVAEGKFVWDTDGWFEIHPQKKEDVRPGSKRNASQAEVDALKRLQTETTVNNPGQAAVKDTGQAAADPPSSNFAATRLDALLPAILDRAFRGEL